MLTSLITKGMGRCISNINLIISLKEELTLLVGSVF